MTKTQILEAIFEKLYARAESVLNNFQPCEHKVINKKHSCLGQSDSLAGNNTPQCCCIGCPSWNKGCKAEKPLTCKTWLCGIAKLNYPKAYIQLTEVANLAKRFGFYVFRGDKNSSMDASIEKHVNLNIYLKRAGVKSYTHAQLRKELAGMK